MVEKPRKTVVFKNVPRSTVTYRKPVPKHVVVRDLPGNTVIVSELPDGAEKVTIDNVSYFEYYGTLYKSVRTNDGHGYQVVGKINDEN